MSAIHHKIDVATSGAHVIVAAVADKCVLVNGGFLLVGGDVSVTLEDSDGIDLCGPLPCAENGGIVWPPVQIGYVKTAVGKGLSIRLSASVQVSGVVVWTYGQPW
jgi:hypothetical protein